MKRTFIVLGLSAMLAMPLLATGGGKSSSSGASGETGSSWSGAGSHMGTPDKQSQTHQMQMHQSDVREAQQRLKEAGFDPGPIDGQLGAQTKEALRDYQKAHGLQQTGQLDESTRELLLAEKTPDSSKQMRTPGGSGEIQNPSGTSSGRTPGASGQMPTPGGMTGTNPGR